MPADLLAIRLELERIGFDASGRMVRLPGPDPEDIPRVLAVLRDDGDDALYVRSDVPRPRAAEILALGPRHAYADDVTVRRIVRTEQWDRGTSYTIAVAEQPPGVQRLGHADADLLARSADPGMADIVRRRPVFAVVEAGEVLAAATAVREDAVASEVWVITHAAHRGRGHAKRVVAAWASDAIERGLIAFYSHSDANVASAGVAHSLGATRWARIAAYA